MWNAISPRPSHVKETHSADFASTLNTSHKSAKLNAQLRTMDPDTVSAQKQADESDTNNKIELDDETGLMQLESLCMNCQENVRLRVDTSMHYLSESDMSNDHHIIGNY